jgi:DNA-binding transcriptional LysR family regulator
MDSTRTPVNWLRAFDVAARHLSFSAAATELNVTPAAVSQQVRLLEHRLGEALFERHARGLRLTRAGETLVPACREAFERLDGALGELFGRRRRGQLVIRVTLGFARQWLLERVATFSREHPDLPIRVIATVWAGEPVDASVDLDIRLAAGPVRGMASHRLTNDEVFPVCSPALASASPRIRQPADLARQWLLERVATFSRQHPDIPLRVVATVWAGEPVDASVDLLIRLAAGPVRGMVSHRLTHDEVFPVCSPALASTSPRIRQPADLARHTLLHKIGFAQGWSHWFAAAGAELPRSTPTLEFDSMRLALDMAAMGHGVALARTSYVEELLRARRLKALFDVRLKARDNVYLIHPHGVAPGSPVALFRDWMLR